MIHIVLENGSTLNLPLDEIASIGGFVEDGVSWLALENWSCTKSVKHAPNPQPKLQNIDNEPNDQIVHDLTF